MSLELFPFLEEYAQPSLPLPAPTTQHSIISTNNKFTNMGGFLQAALTEFVHTDHPKIKMSKNVMTFSEENVNERNFNKKDHNILKIQTCSLLSFI